MLDCFNRSITYLRISVTDRCNIRCRYCMPENNPEFLKQEDILSYEEIRNVVVEGVSLGIEKIRITGGEPLVRKGIVDLVQMLYEVKGVKEVVLTTNGILLSRFAVKLKKAGLARVNVSLDTVDPVEYEEITRGGNITDVFEGIDAAVDAGLMPVRINAVKMLGQNPENADKLKQFCVDKGLQLRFINQMNLESGSFSIVEGGEGGNCTICNRIRLTANGRLKPCLFSDLEYDVRELGPEKAFRACIRSKPERGTVSKGHDFYNIGG